MTPPLLPVPFSTPHAVGLPKRCGARGPVGLEQCSREIGHKGTHVAHVSLVPPWTALAQWEPCLSSRQPEHSPGETWRCDRPVGHEGWHHDGAPGRHDRAGLCVCGCVWPPEAA